jgi:hypothetical protein
MATEQLGDLVEGTRHTSCRLVGWRNTKNHKQRE